MCAMLTWTTDALFPLCCETSQTSDAPANARAERLSISSTTTRSLCQLYMGPESSMRVYPLKVSGNRTPGRYIFIGDPMVTATLPFRHKPL
jgi:hypothetical protein